MNPQRIHYSNKLQALYSLKLNQLEKALSDGNRFRCQVLQAEADAISQELKRVLK